MIKVDATDREIMMILQKNSRIANTEIAKSLGISEATVRKRIAKLEEAGVIRNVSTFNPEALGYQIHTHIGIQVEYSKLESVAEQLKEKEAVFFVGHSTGRFDIIIVAFFHDKEEQYEFMAKEIANIDGIIRTETSSIIKSVKTRAVWGISESRPKGK